MRYSKVQAALRRHEAVRITMLGHYIPAFVAYAAQAGYHAIWIDLEHRAFDPREVQALLAFCHRYDIDALVRPATREKALLYRYLEDGAAGLIIPHVSSVAEAQMLVRSVKFPPLGDRGINPTGLETDFGTNGNAASLAPHALEETSLFVQIETPVGVQHMADIAAVNGVDGILLGPADLALRMKHEPVSQQLTSDEIVMRLAAACAPLQKPWGTIPRTLEELQTEVEQGAQLLVWGMEHLFLQQGLQQAQQQMNQLFGKS